MMATDAPSLLHRAVWLVLLALAAGAVYLPGLSGEFVFDDYANIVQNESVQAERPAPEALLAAALSGSAGPTGRPIAMASFGLDHALYGLNPTAFKATNLVLHLLNALLAYALVAGLLALARTRSLPGVPPSARSCHLLAFTVALLWAVHPLQVTSVLYVVQRMTELAALFTLAALVAYVNARLALLRGGSPWGWLVLAFGLCWPLAVFSKENGILLPAFALAIELGIGRFRSLAPGPDRDRHRVSRTLLAGAGLLVVLPATAFIVILVVQPEAVLGGYVLRDFTPGERLLTEARVVLGYVGKALLPGAVPLSMYHDDLVVSRGLLEPPSTLLALAFWVAYGWLTWACRRRAPLVTVGLAFFFAGHLLESTLYPLELAFEHRNYLPLLGLLLAVVAGGRAVLGRLGIEPRLVPVLAGVVTLALAVATVQRTDLWGRPNAYFIVEGLANPASPRATYDAATAYQRLAENCTGNECPALWEKARRGYLDTLALDPGKLPAAVALFILDEQRAADRLPEPALPGDYRETNVARLVEALGRPIAATWPQAIGTLYRCLDTGDCELSNTQVGRMISAIEANKTINGSIGSLVLARTAEYFWNVQQQADAALYFMQKAIVVNPDYVPIRLEFVELLIAGRAPADARAELESAARLDRFGRYRESITELEDAIENLAAGGRTNGE